MVIHTLLKLLFFHQLPKNKYINVYEYIECTSSIRREGSKKTPLCILSPITSMFLKSDLKLKNDLK
ncbi:hypothetical protein BpHYR1_017869 [Brachionus plicatilis]|uniref:Uncharacterized protein n=1 Tax=Brachionus plicatilis TaxID=10195 RepID=A0A3M7QZB6_BRAPC|nr:hypothetical protein BpHYR1_017869 [Brachionus plicatilis]